MVDTHSFARYFTLLVFSASLNEESTEVWEVRHAELVVYPW